MGRAGFETRIFGLSEADIISLIGMAVSAEDTRNMRLEVVAELVDAIISAVDNTAYIDNQEPKPVPLDKLEFNKLPPHWCHTIRSQMPNVRLVEGYFGRHWEVDRGIKVAAIFKARYHALKAQRLSPADIMGKLYEGIVGIGTVTNDRVVAAQAVLAFLFDSCDIFEDKPAEAVA